MPRARVRLRSSLSASARFTATSAILSRARCILNSETTTDGVAFRVDAERCIGCEACVASFPAIFQMREAKAWVDTKLIPGVRPRPVVQTCPVGAIVCDPAPQAEADVKSLPVVPGWEALWAAHRNGSEDIANRERRYGRRLHVEALRQGWKLTVELPRTLPNHRLFYVHGIDREMVEYDFTLQQIGPRTITLRAQIVGSALRFIAGKINSFPNSFKVDHHFPAAISACFHRREDQGVLVYAFAVGVEDPLAALREAIRGR